VKLLFDQNLSPKLVTRLADHYPESTHVYHIQKDQVSDEELRDYARREGFVIVTKDSNFSRPLHPLRFPALSDLDSSRKLQHKHNREHFARTSRRD
jgi:hypothetical protein